MFYLDCGFIDGTLCIIKMGWCWERPILTTTKKLKEKKREEIGSASRVVCDRWWWFSSLWRSEMRWEALCMIAPLIAPLPITRIKPRNQIESILICDVLGYLLQVQIDLPFSYLNIFSYLTSFTFYRKIVTHTCTCTNPFFPSNTIVKQKPRTIWSICFWWKWTICKVKSAMM